MSEGTRFSKALQIGTTRKATFAAGVILTLVGNLFLSSGVIDFGGDPVVLRSSGAVLSVGDSFVCTSGSCSISIPSRFTGRNIRVLEACISMNRNPDGATFDLGFSATPTSSSGTELMDNILVGSGRTVCASIANFSGGSLWNSGSSLTLSHSSDLNTISGTVLYRGVPNPFKK